MNKLYFSLIAAGLLTCTAASVQAAVTAPQGVVAVADDPYPDQKPYGPDLTMEFVATSENSAVTKGKIICPTNMMSDWQTGAPERPITGKIEKVYVVKSCSDLNQNDIPVTEWTDLNPGEELEFTDNDILLGYNWNYVAYAVVNGNTSESWYGSHGVYTGFRPQSPESIKGTCVEGHAPVTVSMIIPDGVQGTLSDGITYKPERVYVTRTYRPVDDYTYTDPVEVWSQENPETGVEISFVDTNNGDAMEEGVYSYNCYVTWKWGESYPGSVNVGLYEDAPGVPQKITAYPTEEGAVITWTAPIEGNTGGWVNPNTLTYDVYRYINYDRGQLVASDVKGLSAIDNLEGIDKQLIMQYQVIAKNDKGKSSDWGGICEGIVVGPPCALPFVENFPVKGYSTTTDNLWSRQIYAGDANWYTSSSSYFYDDQDNFVNIQPSMEGHGLVMTGYASYYPQGVSCYMSGDIDFSEFEQGTLTFSYYTHPLGSVDLAADIVRYDDFTPEQSDVMPVEEGDAYEMVWFGNCAGEEGWQEVSVDFTGFKDSDTVMIRFRAIQDVPESGIYVPACIQYVKLEGRTGDVHVDTVGAEVSSVEYYNLQGLRINAPAQGEVSIRRTVLTDGTVRTSKVAVK